jgi:hypothetical protein
MVRNRFYEFVELVIPGVAGGQTGTVFNFQDQPQLRSNPIYGIIVYTVDTVPLSMFTGQTVIPTANLLNANLTLYTTDPIAGEMKNGIDRMPLIEFNPFLNTTTVPRVFHPQEFVGQTVTWPKSYVTFVAPPGNTVNWVICFGVRYGWSQKVQQ